MIHLQSPLKQKELGFLVSIHRALNLTSRRYKLLVNNFSSWEEVFFASPLQLSEAQLDKKAIDRFTITKKSINPEQEIENLCKCNAVPIWHGSPDYPKALGEIHDFPPLLFVRGELRETDFPSISIVGARNMSQYGKQCTQLISTEIASAGITIVSGLAYGVDFLAHQTAVKNNARTIGVLGSGIDQITPSAHANIVQQWINTEKMVVISEFLPGTEPRPENFPRRNRIITGLSRATVVIDAAKKSGSLISGHLALEQDREVFAVPGNIFAQNSEGCNQLIADHVASPAISGVQILQQLGLQSQASHNQAKFEVPSTGIEGQIFALLSRSQSVHIDEISRNISIAHSQLSSTLTLMEIKGWIRNTGSQLYIKTL